MYTSQSILCGFSSLSFFFRKRPTETCKAVPLFQCTHEHGYIYAGIIGYPPIGNDDV
jgi:hypothetical protein